MYTFACSFHYLSTCIFLKSSLAAIASNRFPELAIYLETEIKVVEHELLSLHKVMVKLELEMKEAMDTEG